MPIIFSLIYAVYMLQNLLMLYKLLNLIWSSLLRIGLNSNLIDQGSSGSAIHWHMYLCVQDIPFPKYRLTKHVHTAWLVSSIVSGFNHRVVLLCGEMV